MVKNYVSCHVQPTIVHVINTRRVSCPDLLSNGRGARVNNFSRATMRAASSHYDLICPRARGCAKHVVFAFPATPAR